MKLKLRKGFTLIELMIVVCIILILASIAIPGYTRYTSGARRAKCVSNLRAIHEARLAWTAANPQGEIPELPNLVCSGYFRGATGNGKHDTDPADATYVGPNCPAGGQYSYQRERTNVEIKPVCDYAPVDADERHLL